MKELINSVIKERDNFSSKRDYGNLLCICGSYGMAGAAILCGKASLRCGIGLLNIALSKDIYPIVSSNIHEAIYTIYQNEKDLDKAINKASAIAIGCGLSLSASKIVFHVLEKSKVPIILDADALNIISNSTINLKDISTPLILTPHLYEMSRLTNLSTEYIQQNRLAVAKDYAKENKLIVVLKGHETIVVDYNGNEYFNTTGNPGMATGGSGDVLTGMISSMIAQNNDLFNVTCLAVYLHGLAGDLAAKKLSMTSMLPSDIIEQLPEIFLDIEAKNEIK